MQHFSIFEQPTKEARKVFAEKRNLTEYPPENYQYPQEDYLIELDSPPVFVVSDGVTLDFKKLVESNRRYPNPSPAGEIAKIFCNAVVRSVQKKYDRFAIESIKEVFKEANNEVAQYNQKIGKSDISGNITGFYAATGAFIIIKNNKAYRASICDSFVAHFDKVMNVKSISSGLCTPYAIINGEEKMVEYLESGIFDIEKSDRIFVFTDGFEDYVKNPDFLILFKEWDNDLKERIAKFSKEMNVRDPEKYGHERSLIAILF
jgi:serine/threonine protein phosphatase PrpC